MTQVRNISTGPRGAYVEGLLVMVEPGQQVDAENYCDEWFEEVDEDGDDLSKLSVAKLKALAAEEEIDLGDVTKKADIVAAIELAREERQG